MTFAALVPYLVAVGVSFASVFMKGLQYLNVNKNMHKAVFFTSYAMAICDVLIVGVIIKSGLTIAIATGTGGGVGMLTSMWLHNRFVNKEKTS